MTAHPTNYAACGRCHATHDTTGPEPHPALFASTEEAVRDAVATGTLTSYRGQLLCATCKELAQADALAEHGVYDDNRQDVAQLPEHVLTGIFGPARAAQIIASPSGIDMMVFAQRGPA